MRKRVPSSLKRIMSCSPEANSLKIQRSNFRKIELSDPCLKTFSFSLFFRMKIFCMPKECEFLCQEAPSDVSTSLSGSTYPRWKIDWLKILANDDATANINSAATYKSQTLKVYPILSSCLQFFLIDRWSVHHAFCFIHFRIIFFYC